MKYKIVISQMAWAASQALIIFILANVDELKLAGLTILGLGIYAPLGLLLGFNLRNRVAVDVNEGFEKRSVLAFRLTMSAAALVVAGVCIFLYAETLSAAITALFIVATRLADQVSDAATGFYQRDDELWKIARSLWVRAIAQLVPFSLCLIVGLDVVVAAAVAGLLCIFSVLATDGNVLFKKGGRRRSATSWQGLIAVKGKGIGSIFFPFLDSVYANLLRYSAAVLLTAESVGRIGVAQTLYSPMAMFVTAIGYSHLAGSARAVRNGDSVALVRLFMRAAGIGVASLLVALVVLYYMPGSFYELIGLIPVSAGRDVTLMVFFAFAPLVANGFACQTLLAAGSFRHYSINPIIGLVCFGALLVAFLYFFKFSPLLSVFAAFFVSSMARLMFSAYAMLLVRKDYIK